MKAEVKQSLEDSRAIAQKKVERSLRLIEEAQSMISKACGELSPISWGGEAYTRVGDMYDQLSQLHFDVRTSIPWSKIDLDSDAKTKLAKERGV